MPNRGKKIQGQKSQGKKSKIFKKNSKKTK